MPKEILVICSSPEGRNYPKEENQTMLQSLLGADYVPVFLRGEYPGDLPSDRQFDAVLFAGCNVLVWLFKGDYEAGMRTLASILRSDGIIIFTENKNYIGKHSGSDHYDLHALTTTVDKLKIYPMISNNTEGVKQSILDAWKRHFTQSQQGRYIVYTKKTSGGRRKVQPRKTKRKRYSRRATRRGVA